MIVLTGLVHAVLAVVVLSLSALMIHDLTTNPIWRNHR